MALPEGFNDFEHLQSVVRSAHNRRVRESFSDQSDDYDLNVPRSSLKLACLMQDNDTCDMMVMRSLLFNLTLGELAESLEPYYGFPVSEYKGKVDSLITIILKFVEDESQVEEGYQPLRMQVTFTLPHETNASITKTDLIAIGNRAKTEFPISYRFHKGKELYTYVDRSKGFDFQLYSFSETEAIDLIKKVQDIANREGFNEELFKTHTTKNATGAYPTIPGTATVLGETVKKPRKRPVGYVRLRQVFADIPLAPRQICLIDRSGRLKPLVEAGVF